MPVKPEATRWELESCDLGRILFVGRFDRHKGADCLLRAFAALAPSLPNLRLDFVGNDVGLMLEDGKKLRFAEFIERTIPTAFADRIKFHGPLSHFEIDKLRTKAYVTIVPSRFDNSPNTVIEAMAAGCPIIASNVGGIAEVVFNNINGLTVPPDDIDELVAAIQRLLQDPLLAARLGERAAHDCEVQFQPSRVAQQYIDFGNEIIERRRKTALSPQKE